MLYAYNPSTQVETGGLGDSEKNSKSEANLVYTSSYLKSEGGYVAKMPQ